MKTDYYVYGHYLKKDDSLFYIGKGRRLRLTQLSSRSKDWKNATSTNEWYAKIIKGELSSKDALDLETSLILSTPNLLNKVSKTSTNQIPSEFLDYFYYDESSPSCLKWAKDVVGYNGRVYQKTGDNAGFIRSGNDRDSKRWNVAVNHKCFYGHRIVYALHNELCPESIIDHVDGNSLNNLIGNLRQVSQEVNSRNTKIYSNNSTGIVGVSRIKRKRLNFVIYVATCADKNGKQFSKEFSCYKLSEDQAFQAACNWRNEQIAELNLQGAGYTDRHGT